MQQPTQQQPQPQAKAPQVKVPQPAMASGTTSSQQSPYPSKARMGYFAPTHHHKSRKQQIVMHEKAPINQDIQTSTVMLHKNSLN